MPHVVTNFPKNFIEAGSRNLSLSCVVFVHSVESVPWFLKLWVFCISLILRGKLKIVDPEHFHRNFIAIV